MTIAIAAIAVVLLIAVDQLTKYAAVINLKGSDPFMVIDGFLQFRYVENTGAAFGILTGKTFILVAFTGVLLLAGIVLLFSGKVKDKLMLSALALFLAGGLGNLIDRIFRAFVVDFIEVLFIEYPVFNFADCCVTVAAVLIFISVFVDIKNERTEKDNKKPTATLNETGNADE